MAYKDTYSGSYLLAVGIDTYQDPRFTPLGKAEEDAQSIAEVLSGEPYNFEPTLLLGEQATRRAILTELGKLRRTDPDDRILFYFAGHGYVLPDNRDIDVGYLACADTVPDDPYGGLEFDEVTKIRRFANAKHIGFILDACFSGTVFKMTRAAVTDLAISEYHKHRAYQVLTAGAVEVVSDARSMTGELVRVLREGIPGHAGPMTFNHIGQCVHDVIHAQSKGMQSPIYQYLEGSGKGQMVLYAPCAVDMLPERLRRGLKSEDADTRFFAIAEAEKLLDDPACGEAVRAVLEDMQYDDPDRDVRRRAGEAVRDTPPVRPAVEVITPEPEPVVEMPQPEMEPEPEPELEPGPEPEPVVKMPQPEPEPEPEPARHPILDILPQPFEWCEIPAGRVTLEDNAGTFDVQPFFMAKYQTTYEQFQVFIDAEDGFTDDAWWQGLAKRESEPGKQHFTHDRNLPRENVSWYDAVAFCRWLSSRVGYEVRLPTEWEWQWAAQGPDGLVYPWGNKYIHKGYANIDERPSGIKGGAYLEKTTPVGSYPKGASPYGVLDMSGNVWEWCLNEYDNPERTDTTGDARRVVRGGSWRSLVLNARDDARFHRYPDARYFGGGFRVVGFAPVLK